MTTYCILDTNGHAKIGLSSDVTRRFNDLQTAHATPLVLYGTIPGNAEKMLHHKYAHLRTSAGNEWFHAAPSLLAEFTQTKGAQHVKPAEVPPFGAGQTPLGWFFVCSACGQRARFIDAL